MHTSAASSIIVGTQEIGRPADSGNGGSSGEKQLTRRSFRLRRLESHVVIESIRWLFGARRQDRCYKDERTQKTIDEVRKYVCGNRRGLPDFAKQRAAGHRVSTAHVESVMIHFVNHRMSKKQQILTGDTFDKAYVKDMIKNHQEDIAEFQKEAMSGQDPDAKAFAAATLPTLQEHLKRAQAVAAEMGILKTYGHTQRISDVRCFD